MTLNPDSDNWDRNWSDYSAAADLNPAQRFRFERILELAQRDIPNIRQVIDVGCGTGGFLHIVQSRLQSAQVLGIEPSSVGASKSAERIGHKNVICVDITKQPIDPTRILDDAVIVCSEVLEHLDEPETLLSSIYSSLMGQGSRLVVSVPGGPRSAFDVHIGHREHFTKQRLKSLLSEAGFSNVHIYRAGYPFFNLYKILTLLLGRRLIRNADTYSGASNGSNRLSVVALWLMVRSCRDCRFGWQLFATAERG